jgi:pyruvate/2-oxoglutarate dehydrogenase complex dihydrolipoamide acyltransferase (E2) component
MDRTLVLIGGIGSAAVVVVGAAAWFMPTHSSRPRPDPPPAPAPVAPAPAPPPVVAATPAAPAPVAPAPAPAPAVNPDAGLYDQEIDRINSEREGLWQSMNVYKANGMLTQQEETLARIKALPSVYCLQTEQRRGAPFYPALATCRSVTAAR